MIYRYVFGLTIFFPLLLNAQNKDTVYFDYNWSICESPVAVYYRVASVNKSKLVYYTGDVADYYINGQMEMRGHYNENGAKNGKFTSYYENGLVKREVSYSNDTIRGTFSYYDSTGRLKLQLDCRNAGRFIPSLLINKAGDTLVKNGTGKFILDKKEFPDIFSSASSGTMEGILFNGKMEGNVVYSTGSKIEYTESYKNGKFQSGQFADDHITNYERGVMILYSEKLKRVDDFYHCNPLFREATHGNTKALDFIINKTVSGIQSDAKTFDDNYICLFKAIGYVEKGFLPGDESVFFGELNNERQVIKINTNPSSGLHPKILRATITITVDTSGYISNSVVKGNLGKNEIDQINYYLSNIYGLAPYTENKQKISKDVNLKLYTFIDTIRNNGIIERITWSHLVENGDKKDITPLPVFPDIEAKFPGGQGAWHKFLERNLNRFAIYNSAPKGIYTALVSFAVDDQGKISDIKLIKDPGYGAAEEALRVLKYSPHWTPAVKNGKNIKSVRYQSISFEVKEAE